MVLETYPVTQSRQPKLLQEWQAESKYRGVQGETEERLEPC